VERKEIEETEEVEEVDERKLELGWAVLIADDQEIGVDGAE
jgi:hypothetical protein